MSSMNRGNWRSFVEVDSFVEPIKKSVQDVTSERLAVVIDSGVKTYGRKIILQNLNMRVNEGTIYSLLGSSGCGKTTLLSCIVGLRHLNSGWIRVCGKIPGSNGSGVPGKLVGYMPQEIALNGEFTVNEACHYFGRLYGLEMDKVGSRVRYLVNLLHLSKCTGLIKNFSGGEKRRISFAVALIHEPEILILDEPTVGVDPLLRQAIWQHLQKLVQEKRTTIIITTHYVEETQNSNCIGLMRNGRLIIEESPNSLLQRYQSTLLEDVVLKYCLKDEETIVQKQHGSIRKSTRSQIGLTTATKTHSRLDEESIHSENSLEELAHGWDPQKDLSTKCWQRLQAMFIKNIYVLFRSIGYLLFLFILPALQIVMICVCLSSDPKSLRYGIVNNEIPYGVNCSYEGGTCQIANLSCGYIQALHSETIVLLPVQSEELALKRVKNGDLIGYLTISQNFTDALFDRVIGNAEANLNETISATQIHFQMDMTNNQISMILQSLFIKRFRYFVRGLVSSCGQNPDSFDIPIVFDPPVYGEDGGKITNFVTPGVTTAFLSFLSSLTCGLAFIGEKKDGMVHRNIVAGVKKLEIMLAHLVTQFIVLLVQTTIAFLAMFILFSIPHFGSISLAFILVLLNGVAGMSLGFLAATYCNEEKHAMLVAIGTILPCFLVSGAIFPSEALPISLQYISYLLPGTLPGNALRAILLKGWGIDNFVVWIGLVSATAWIFIYWIITAVHHFIWK